MANRRIRYTPPSLFKRFLRLLLVLAFAGFAFLAGIGVALVQGYQMLGQFLPEMTQFLEDHRTQLRSIAYDQEGEPIAEYAFEKRDWVPLEKISPNFVHALLGFEDVRFDKRFAVDPIGMARALVVNLREGDFGQGASTITQQLARNILRDHAHSFERKIKEIFLAIAIENAYTKDEVIELYANEVYFGKGNYGVEVASQTYFGVHASDLALAQAAYLVSLLKNPNAYSRDPELGLQRRDIVLKKLLRENYHFSAEQLEKALEEPLGLRPLTEEPARPGAYFTEFVRLNMQEAFGTGLYKRGLRIQTTLDQTMQRKAEKGFREGLAQVEELVFQGVARLPKSEQAAYYREVSGSAQPQRRRLEGGFILVDAKTGHIKAMVGGRDFNTNQFNRATSAYRQPGSTFKILIYSTGFNEGLFTPESTIADRPGTWGGWSPSNYDGSYKGSIPVIDAIAQSRNLPAVRALDQVGVTAVLDTAYKLGLRGPFTKNLTLALGASEVSPLEMAGVLSAVANDGLYIQPTPVTRVESHDGSPVKTFVYPKRRVLSTQAGRMMQHSLEKAANAGTGTRIRRLIGYQGYVAGKTGTTNNFTDAWFVGIFQVPEPLTDYEYKNPGDYPKPLDNPMVAVMYVGFDQKLSLGPKMAGGRLVAPIVGHIMKDIQGQEPLKALVIP